MEQKASTISSVDVANYLPSNFATVAEVRQAMPKIRVVRNTEIEKVFGTPIPIHHVVTDSAGDTIVIEYTKGKLAIYDNKIGVMTNSPNYDWHLLNLRNYANLRAIGAPASRDIDGVSLTPFGAGSGMLGLPGDFTPPSRFIRAAAFVHTMEPVKDAQGGVSAASTMLKTLISLRALCARASPKMTICSVIHNGPLSPIPAIRSITTGPCTTDGCVALISASSTSM